MNTLSPNGSLVPFEIWIAAIASSACIGFTSLVPWLFNLTFFERQKTTAQQGDQDDGGDPRMKYLLSFAIGAILGDIFFHLIPESIESHLVELGNSDDVAQRNVGTSIIAGIFLFIIVEMVLQKWSGQEPEEDKNPPKSVDHVTRGPCKASQDLKQNSTNSVLENNNNATTDLNGCISCKKSDILESSINISDLSNNNHLASSLNQNLVHRKQNQKSKAISDDARSALSGETKPPKKLTSGTGETTDKNLITIDPAGYLNLIANGFDNFTHGLAIGASFLVGMKVGVLTTFVIFIHEIPHEICDYAILVKSGFSRWEAVKAQSSVSLFGIMGTAIALYVKSVDKLNAKTVWILPFSAGGFLYIALVTLLPDILDKQSNIRESVGQVASVILGIAFMGLVALL